jgi:hypothetical protein
VFKTFSPPEEGMAVLCSGLVMGFAIAILDLNSNMFFQNCVFRLSFMLLLFYNLHLERTINSDLNATSPPREGSK